jgi:hypothetical protein
VARPLALGGSAVRRRVAAATALTSVGVRATPCESPSIERDPRHFVDRGIALDAHGGETRRARRVVFGTVPSDLLVKRFQSA